MTRGASWDNRCGSSPIITSRCHRLTAHLVLVAKTLFPFRIYRNVHDLVPVLSPGYIYSCFCCSSHLTKNRKQQTAHWTPVSAHLPSSWCLCGGDSRTGRDEKNFKEEADKTKLNVQSRNGSFGLGTQVRAGEGESTRYLRPVTPQPAA